MVSRATQSPPAGPAEPRASEYHYVQASASSGYPAEASGVVEVDIETDSESSYESGLSSETTSVSSSVFSFTYANGRRYQSDRFNSAEYFMPNDDLEQDRLDLYHHIFLLLLGGKLYLAPLENPQRVLDVGTGTGIWAIDFADLHPGAKVIGTDISPIQPSWIPPNLVFQIDDMEEDWTFQEDFDYIHMRTLSGSFKDWDAMLAKAFKKTTPGGYVEFQDYGCEIFKSDGTKLDGINPDYPGSTYFFHTISAAERAGRPLVVARGIAERMEKAGFVDVEQKIFIWPLGPWPKEKDLKELGRWGKVGMEESALTFALYLLTREGWTEDEIKAMVNDFLVSIKKRHYYCQGWFIYGRKPAVKS